MVVQALSTNSYFMAHVSTHDWSTPCLINDDSAVFIRCLSWFTMSFGGTKVLNMTIVAYPGANFPTWWMRPIRGTFHFAKVGTPTRFRLVSAAKFGPFRQCPRTAVRGWIQWIRSRSRDHWTRQVLVTESYGTWPHLQMKASLECWFSIAMLHDWKKSNIWRLTTFPKNVGFVSRSHICHCSWILFFLRKP